MSLCEHSNRALRIAEAIPEVAAEVVPGPAWQDSQGHVISPTCNQSVSHVAPGAVAADRYNDVVPLLDRLLGQLRLFTGASR
jgi:hypothetical protein